MLICRVIGTAVSTVKHEQLANFKLLIVREMTLDGQPVGEPFVAIDAVGAGENEAVLVAQGSVAAAAVGLQGRGPVDASIVGILDYLSTGGQVVFRK